MAGPQADLPFTSASLKWRNCTKTPFGMRDAHAVYLNKLYVGGGDTPSDPAASSTVVCYEPKISSWKTIKSPTSRSALTTYQDKLVLVGGMDGTGHATNKLWSLQDDDKWANELPPMPTPRCTASAVNTESHLMVAGGGQHWWSNSNVVEVFDGKLWMKVESLPKECHNMKSTIHNGEWYLIGGDGQGKSVFCATVDSLIATTGSSEGEGSSVWKSLPEAPHSFSSIVMCGNLLLAIGGGDSTNSHQSAIYGYITGTRSWVQVGNLPKPISAACSTVIPYSELVVVGGWIDNYRPSSFVFKATLGVPCLQQLCVMTIVGNNIDCLQLPQHLQKIVERYF